ncbi:hypothetical protein PMAA_020530 [Talaromyces marneffei ATCC 18224]|uniref:Uncharacterized protein n=1 Tax=Talaromyces marneffei (strain ATCC 18224 / CBS 334.59 / QM 7333) TaxID=441960 RepID=B6Q3W9_TALMQ|nr:hypothetical protein PMAA_020530 [Talaromyces marneffei ATCC 18224]
MYTKFNAGPPHLWIQYLVKREPQMPCSNDRFTTVFLPVSARLYFQVGNPGLLAGLVGAGRGRPLDGAHDGETDDGRGIVMEGVWEDDGDLVGVDALDVQEVEFVLGADEE